MVLQAKDVSFHYKESGPMILDRISFEVQEGERVGLRGKSGIGKTTLCRLMAGYEKPLSGQVLLDGRPVADYRGCCPVQMVWQHPEQAVNPRRRMHTVLDEGDRVSGRIVKELGIEEAWKTRFPAELSGGELQRFCIARALGESTRFLLADEISTMLDLITQSQIWNFLLEEAKRRNLGMVVVSHSDALLEHVCTRIVDI
ncbi:MAG TPA: ATP-binding cassette domain-containing protein [Candidatus Choladousia intestinipullorum]|nr:ATP-binding cassette domain-containing protein [Candidatus Choladousia intestinipullorum]